MTRNELIEGLNLIPEEFGDCQLMVFIGPSTRPEICKIDALKDDEDKPLVVVFADNRIADDPEAGIELADTMVAMMTLEMLQRIPSVISEYIKRNGSLITLDGHAVYLPTQQNESEK